MLLDVSVDRFQNDGMWGIVEILLKLSWEYRIVCRGFLDSIELKLWPEDMEAISLLVPLAIVGGA